MYKSILFLINIHIYSMGKYMYIFLIFCFRVCFIVYKTKQNTFYANYYKRYIFDTVGWSSYVFKLVPQEIIASYSCFKYFVYQSADSVVCIWRACENIRPLIITQLAVNHKNNPCKSRNWTVEKYYHCRYVLDIIYNNVYIQYTFMI